MKQSTDDRSPTGSAEATKADISEEGLRAQAAATPTGEERYAAVCAGAVKHLRDLRAFAGALTSTRHHADDLVQTAILRALDAAQQFTPGTNFKAWIFTILRNAFYNQWRSSASRQISLEECDSYAPVTAASQDSSLEFCDFRRAFAQLVPEQREALLLVGASGLDYAEVAAICGCATGTVKSRVSRARATLRALMDGGVMDLSRQDVAPISTLDLKVALEASGAGLNAPGNRRLPTRPSSWRGGGDAVAALSTQDRSANSPELTP